MHNELSPAYLAAIDAHNAAQAAFGEVRDLYRAGKVGDATFLAARAEMRKADEAFDVAFNAEASK